jgi:hypothetical protein
VSAPRQRWPRAAVVSAVVLAVLMLGALLVPVFSGYPVGPLVVVSLLVVLGAAVGAGLVLRAQARRRGWAAFERSVLWDVGDRERTAIREAIRHSRPAPEHLRAVARRSAEQTAARRPLACIIGVLAVGLAIDAAVQPGFGHVPAGVEAAALLLLAGSHLLEAHRAQRYLNRADTDTPDRADAP